MHFRLRVLGQSLAFVGLSEYFVPQRRHIFPRAANANLLRLANIM
jgi:hypothetical protein